MILTVDDEFATGFDADGRSSVAASIADGQKRIDGRTDQFGIVILGRRDELQ